MKKPLKTLETSIFRGSGIAAEGFEPSLKTRLKALHPRKAQ